MNNIFIISFFYILSVISTLGYGFIFKKLFIKDKIKIDYGISGLIGIFFLTLYSFISHFFIGHGLFHNSIIILFGLILFLILFKSNYEKVNLNITSLIFLILLISLFCFKTHDDFPYYHFPYTNYLTKTDLIVGIGNYDPSWRSASSIFYFNSLFYLPIIKFYLYHIGALLIMGFSLISIFLGAYQRYNLKKFDHIFFFQLLSFTFILVFFYRLSEHGTDRSAQILSFILILEILLLTIKDQDFETFCTKTFLIGCLAISLKVFYLIFLVLLIPVIVFLYKEKKYFYFKRIIKNKLLYLSVFFLVLLSVINFLNSGCFLYPITITCLDNFSWSVPIDEVQRMKIHYENWSKAGATPNFSVDNYENYVSKFNWLGGWIDRYFFNKVSDYLLGLGLLSIIFTIIFFSSKKKRNKKINLVLLYFSIVILFIEWFYNHPSLRYGGYYIIAMLIFIPLSKFLSSFQIHEKKFLKKIVFILFLTISIFFYRNIDRIVKENEKYDYSPFKNVYYQIDEKHHFRVEKNFNEIIKFYNNCTEKRIRCTNENKLLAFKKFNKYIFVKSSNYYLEENQSKYFYKKRKND